MSEKVESTQEELQAIPPMPEAPASLNIRFASQMGFECQLTLRSFDEETGGIQLLLKLGAIEEKLHKKGCRPIFGRNSAPKAEAPDIPVIKEHWCDEHKCEFQKWERDGRSWYSHKVNGTDEWCNESKKK